MLLVYTTISGTVNLDIVMVQSAFQLPGHLNQGNITQKETAEQYLDPI